MLLLGSGRSAAQELPAKRSDISVQEDLDEILPYPEKKLPSFREVRRRRRAPPRIVRPARCSQGCDQLLPGVKRVIGRQMNKLAGCYRELLKNRPGLKGVIVVRMAIDRQGRISDLSATRNSTGSEALGKCVLKRLRKLRFPAHDRPRATFTFPFAFVSQ